MTEERCKQLMEQVGLPNSRSLYSALYQLANEKDQEALAAIETARKEGYMARANEEGEEYRTGVEWGRAEAEREIAEWLNDDIGGSCNCETCNYVREAAVRIKASTYHRNATTPNGDENE